jgi:hypothetical protein
MDPQRLEEIRQAYLKETNVTGFWRSAVGELLEALGVDTTREKPEKTWQQKK